MEPTIPMETNGTSFEQLDLLELFGGEIRPWSLTDSARRIGCRASAMDTLYDPSHDILLSATYNHLLKWVSSGAVKHLWMGAPCVSYTAMWAWNKIHPFRSRNEPDGLEAMPARWAKYVDKHNEITRRVQALAIAQFKAGRTYYIENPCDQGEVGSPFFTPEAAGSVPIWITSFMRNLRKQTAATFATTDLCEWQGEFRKPTTIMAAGPCAHLIEPINSIRCSHAKHLRRVIDTDADGNPVSKSAGQYPRPFCIYFAAAFRTGIPPPIAPLLASPTSAPVLAEQLGASLRQQPGLELIESNVEANLSWRSAHEQIPRHWPEAEDVVGERYVAARQAALPFISRRRAQAEDAEVLARQPFPQPSKAPATQRQAFYKSTGWLCTTQPAEPVDINSLWLDGVYLEVDSAIQTVVASCKEGDAGRAMPKVEPKVFALELMAPFAREHIESGGRIDSSNPRKCKPLQPFSREEPVDQAVNTSFFSAWGRKLDWPDKDMLEQIHTTGAEGRSACSKATIVMGHHGGLRANFAVAKKVIDADASAGFLRPGTQHPPVFPAIMTAKNCVERTIYKLDGDELSSVTKFRVTTDDSIEIEGETSRNTGMDPDTWPRAGLPGPRTLGEAVAIAKAACANMGIHLEQWQFERIALWALDLSHAYRMLAINRFEWGQQLFCWTDGVRLDLRCLFGSAHMVDFFERVTVFVLTVSQFRTAEYHSQHPTSTQRQAWSTWREEHVGAGEGRAYASFVYLDDASGVSTVEPGEDISGGHVDFPVRASLHIEPGATVRLQLFAKASRPQIDLAIARRTFQEAGWEIALDKVQLGWSIDQLGFTVDTTGAGALVIPEAKRRGMIEDISLQQSKSGVVKIVKHQLAERLIGRCVNLATVIVEAAPYLAAMYRIKEAKVVIKAHGKRLRITPKFVAVSGDGAHVDNYQQALAWWKHALESRASAPLAPKRHYPDLGEPGVAFLFSDAAREAGTGYGGFSMIERREVTEMLYLCPAWEPDALLALQQNLLSMPAGEGLGVVALADAIARELPGLTHLVVFTDSSPVASALNSDNSASPQLNVIIKWLIERHPKLQLMGIHEPGVRNEAADDLSRGRAYRVLEEARAANLTCTELTPAHSFDTLITTAMRTPQRAPPPRPPPQAK